MILASLVLGLAVFLLGFACMLLNLAFRLACGIVGDLADTFLHGALDLVLGTFSAMLIHGRVSAVGGCGSIVHEGPPLQSRAEVKNASTSMSAHSYTFYQRRAFARDAP